jgi:hypothetical protein
MTNVSVSDVKRVVGSRLLRLFVCMNFLAIPFMFGFGSAPAQERVLTDSEIVASLRALRSEMLDLLSQVAGKGAAMTRPSRRTMDYESYRRTFESYSAKIDDCYRRLAAYYSQIDRVYRTGSSTPLYKRMLQTYLDAKGCSTI